MTIAIDIDNTWSLDPVAFKAINSVCTRLGHEVIIVTRRSEVTLEDREKLQIPGDMLVICCTPSKFKRHHVESIGLHVDIWIDDEPGTIEPQRLLSETTDRDL